MTLNVLLFVYCIYTYLGTGGGNVNYIAVPLKENPLSKVKHARLQNSSVHKVLVDLITADDSSRLIDQFEEIEVPKSMKTKKDSEVEVKKEVPVNISGDQKWSEKYQVQFDTI